MDLRFLYPASSRLPFTAEPIAMLKTAPNFRDIGGLLAKDGRKVRSGLIYRSDALDALDADDLLRMADLGIKVCCDLRSEGERLQRPSRWPEAAVPRTLCLEVATDIRVLIPGLARQFREDPSAEGAARLMQQLYRDLPVACAPALTRAFSLISDEQESLPLVIHCTAGKDRTGFIIAMLLYALGVPAATITADYLRTNQAGGRLQLNGKIAQLLEALLGMTPQPEMLAAVTAARAEYLQAALERIAEDHGSVDAYLAAAAGLDANRRAQLNTRLLEEHAESSA